MSEERKIIITSAEVHEALDDHIQKHRKRYYDWPYPKKELAIAAGEYCITDSGFTQKYILNILEEIFTHRGRIIKKGSLRHDLDKARKEGLI